MALQNTDLFILERAGVQYKMTANEIADFVGAVNDSTASNIVGRDALTNVKIGDRVFVTDASADPSVDSGWAVYRVQSITPNVFEKIQEQESMDLTIVANTNLGYTAAPASGTITNDNGTTATIPLADSTNSGLMSPAAFDDIHPLATSGLTAASNPVNITASQEITFSITQLTDLP